MTTPHPRRVVLHVSDDPVDIDRAVDTAHTLRETFPDANIRVIVNGPALEGLRRGSPLPGVQACAIGLQRRKIDPSDLREGVEIIPSAATALIEAQFDGAAYIRI